ncbi:MAG TPA: hypothetical protein VG326_14835 [Tepidisphaeraceae bacterium]|jgi:hypothetical protein|nr:hypothetical protein [Tepidisphaeraceae bacterium]
MHGRNQCDADLKNCVEGAVAGLIGTFALWGTQMAIQKYLPDAVDPMREDPGKFAVRKVQDSLPKPLAIKIPEKTDSRIGQFIGFFYGMTFGSLYAWARPKGGSVTGDGLALGLVCWAAGYLGWLPAIGLMSPVWRQRAPQIMGPIVHHIVFGVATVGAFDLLKEHV